MYSPNNDAEAWLLLPSYRAWFDKLLVSQRLGYLCGPGGVAPKVSGAYIVRPIYNLSGMGAGARRQWIDACDDRGVEPGYFWCEYFTGDQHSVSYEWNDTLQRWLPLSSWKGTLAEGSLTRFLKWERSSFAPQPPAICNELSKIGQINVEYIGDKAIEIHLRLSPDPEWGDEIIPVWSDQTPPDADFFESFDDADGHIGIARLGFVVKTKSDKD